MDQALKSLGLFHDYFGVFFLEKRKSKKKKNKEKINLP